MVREQVDDDDGCSIYAAQKKGKRNFFREVEWWLRWPARSRKPHKPRSSSQGEVFIFRISTRKSFERKVMQLTLSTIPSSRKVLSGEAGGNNIPLVEGNYLIFEDVVGCLQLSVKGDDCGAVDTLRMERKKARAPARKCGMLRRKGALLRINFCSLFVFHIARTENRQHQMLQ